MTAADGGPVPLPHTAGRVALQPLDFLRVHGRLFGLTDPVNQLIARPPRQDALGYTHTTYSQVHRGVPVFSGVLKVHQDAAGRVVGTNGDFYPISAKLDLVPSLEADAALAVATATVESAKPRMERRELVIVDPGWYGDPPTGEQLAYYIVLSDLPAAIHEAFFVDAHDGKILDQWTLIHDARNREIYDGERTSDLPGVLARAEGGDPVKSPEDVNRAYDYYGDTYDYYFRAFGRDSVDDEGLTLVATINSLAPGCPNAFWSSSRRQMVFCTGTVTDDVVAHELTHGVTDFTADLIYQNQAGQLNESYSDVFGELVDLFNGDGAFVDSPAPGAPELWPVHPTGPGVDQPNTLRTGCSPDPTHPDGVRWLVAEDATAFGGAIRDMWDPPCEGDPDRANSPLQTCNPADNGGVHSGSGIPNHAFAILTDGKTFNGHTVNALGPIKAGAVWFRALTTYLTPASDFRDAYDALNQSAFELIGTFPIDPRTGSASDSMFTAEDAAEVDKALLAVEMDTPGRCGQTVPILDPDPAPLCAQRTILFTDEFEHGPGGWTVSNSLPLTPFDWVQTTTPLPFSRPGVAWFCDDPDLGDCDEQDESGVHSLFSPPIQLPRGSGFPLLTFTHYIATETGWDGGSLSLRVNGGARWRTVPGSAFQFNSYNAIIRPPFYGNTNPLRNQEGWTGIGGRWGTSLVDLSRLVSPGDTVEFRFDFGKDGCTGRVGWYIDDVEVSVCPDCNRNQRGDHQDFYFTHASGPLHTIGTGFAQTYTIPSPPIAEGDVTLIFAAGADLNTSQEYIDMSINGRELGRLYDATGRDCPILPDLEALVIPARVFNEAVDGGDALIRMDASREMDPARCGGGTFIKVFIEYEARAADVDANGIPDECENCRRGDAAVPAANVQARNRYLAFQPGNSERLTALRVTFTDLPSRFEKLEGDTMWVDRPTRPQGSTSPSTAVPQARLTCDQVFRDWGQDGVIEVLGEEIVPGATYTIEALDVACVQPLDPDRSDRSLSPGVNPFSPGLAVSTVTRWGDIVGPTAEDGPDGNVDFLDISAVVDRFRNLPGALPTAFVDLYPEIPDEQIDFVDVSMVVGAFGGADYPYPGPRGCP